jgi:predicted TIM-barrel fold metal-dependent hydrolase
MSGTTDRPSILPEDHLIIWSNKFISVTSHSTPEAKFLMSQTTPRTKNIQQVIDCDFHLTESMHDFLGHIEDPFHEMIFNEADNLQNIDFYPSAGLFNTMRRKTRQENVSSREEIIEGMELLNLDRVIATPTKNLYLAGVHHDELAFALSRAYNKWVLDEIYDEEEGIYGPILVAPQMPEEAAKEIDDRASEDEFVSAFIPSGGLHPPLGDSQYHPIYDACSKNDLPIMMHNASGTQILNFPFQYHGTKRYMSNHAPTHVMTHMMHLTTLITQGVPVLYPNLEFVIQEAGLGWIPYMKKRLDNEHSEKKEDAPMLEKPPSQYIEDQFYFTSQPAEGTKDTEYITNIVSMIGSDSLMFSSDYPHLDFDYTDELYKHLKREFNNVELDNIYGGNASRVFF